MNADKPEIRYLQRKDLDEERWNCTIAASRAEILYPYSWYLDRAAEHWSALMMGDYQYLMPLVWKRKWGIPLIYQPFYTQQLGIFSEEYVDPHIASRFIEHIPSRFRYVQFNFNAQNLVGEAPERIVTDRLNYILPLTEGYDGIRAGYSTNALRNLKKGEESQGPLLKEATCRELVDFKRKHDVVERRESQYLWLTGLLEHLVERKAGIIYTIGRGEELNAGAFFAFSRQRAIYLLSVSSETGKEQRSMFRIVDRFIRDHAESGLTLDFEGSNIPSVARFFSGFGARPETYQSVGIRKFPFTWLKR